jgi:hypothetical protein
MILVAIAAAVVGSTAAEKLPSALLVRVQLVHVPAMNPMIASAMYFMIMVC